eukprot:4124778-Amphidinium_carterae.1
MEPDPKHSGIPMLKHLLCRLRQPAVVLHACYTVQHNVFCRLYSQWLEGHRVHKSFVLAGAALPILRKETVRDS